MRGGKIYIFSKFSDGNYHSFSVVLDFLCTYWVVSVGFSSSAIGLSLCVHLCVCMHELSALLIMHIRIISSYSCKFFLISLMYKMRKWEWHISQRNSIHWGKSPSSLCGLGFSIRGHSLFLLLLPSSSHYKIRGNEEIIAWKEGITDFKCGLHRSMWS